MHHRGGRMWNRSIQLLDWCQGKNFGVGNNNICIPVFPRAKCKPQHITLWSISRCNILNFPVYQSEMHKMRFSLCKEFLMCSVSQVGLPHDADDLHDRNVLPPRNSHRTSLEHLSVAFHTRDQTDLVSVCKCVYCMSVDVWFWTHWILFEGLRNPS